MKTFREYLTETSEKKRKNYLAAAEASKFSLAKKLAAQWSKGSGSGYVKDRPDNDSVRKYDNRVAGIKRALKSK